MVKKGRNKAIDSLKGILVILMVLTHCIQFFGEEQKFLQKIFVDYVNLTTFSGFMFAFGYVSYVAYLEKGFQVSWKRMLINIGKLLIGFYISSICFYAFVEDVPFQKKLLFDILKVNTYAGWSEFLVSFAGVMVMGFILFPVLKKMNGKVFIVLTAISLLTCMMPYDKIKIPQLALLVGSTHFITFPIIQYFSYFALGILVSKKNIKFQFEMLIGTVVMSLPCIIFYVSNGGLPERFPPTWLYITGGFGFIYIFFILSEWLTVRNKTNRMVRSVSNYLQHVGYHSLFYLLISNILIFGFSGSKFRYIGFSYAFGFFLLTMIITRYLIFLIQGKVVETKR